MSLNKFEKLKTELSSKFSCKVKRRKRNYFDDIVISDIRKGMKSKIIMYIRTEFKDCMTLRTNMDNELIYFWLLTSSSKMQKIKKQLEIDKVRFKWLYEKIKDEEAFMKNAKVIKENSEDAK